jgi:Icc-related predicted phosphoesterase
MKILVVADLHYALKQYDWLKSVAADFDVVVLAGDLLEIASSVERRAQIVVVRAYLEELAARTRVIVCSGNHDLDSRSPAGELTARWVAELDDIGVTADWGSVTVGGTLITVCPWWDGEETRAGIGRQLAADALRPRDRWIWVYHAPPAGSPVSWSGRRHHGDEALTAWIGEYAPDIVMSGHVHNSPFVEGGSWADPCEHRASPDGGRGGLDLPRGLPDPVAFRGAGPALRADARDPRVAQSRGSGRSSSGVTGRSSCWVRSEPRIRSTMPRWLSSSMNWRLRSAR